MLSVVIPARNEPYLKKTIDDLLGKSEGDIEIIAVLDGYWPDEILSDDPRVRTIHFGESRGMRAAINAGVALAKGEYIMKTDAHCLFGQGYDRILLEEIEDNWVVIPRRYHLDPVKWAIIEEMGYTDYDKLIIHKTRNKFHGQEWRTRRRKRLAIEIDETMSFQGSCWVMSRKWWDQVIGELDPTGYGQFSQEPIEIGMKTWTNGGKLMVNKRTWYAHKDRKFKRTHNVPGEETTAASEYAMKIWMPEYLKLKEYFQI